MIFETALQQALELTREHQEWLGPLVFVLGLGESIPVVSILVPSTVIFVGIGAAHGAAGGSFVGLWLAGAAGAFVGDVIVYVAGRLFKRRLFDLWPLSRYPGWWQTGHDFFERWGAPGIVASKFMGPLRSLMPVVAGALQMPARIFLPSSAVSALVWAGVLLGPGSLGLGWIME